MYLYSGFIFGQFYFSKLYSLNQREVFSQAEVTYLWKYKSSWQYCWYFSFKKHKCHLFTQANVSKCHKQTGGQTNRLTTKSNHYKSACLCRLHSKWTHLKQQPAQLQTSIFCFNVSGIQYMFYNEFYVFQTLVVSSHSIYQQS